jgi:hypothetical protein
MANDDNLEALATVLLSLEVDFGNQRTGSINDPQSSFFRVLDHCCGHTMGAEDSQCTGWYLIESLNEQSSLVFQVLDHMAVVDDLMQNIDRGAMNLEGPFNNFYSSHHPRTKSAGLSKYHLHSFRFHSLRSV